MAEILSSPEEEMLKKLKRILGKNDAADPEASLLQDALNDAEDVVKGYCNFTPKDPIPPALRSTVVKIAVDIWRAEGFGQEERPREITSVKRGDVTTSFASSGGDPSAGGGAGFVRSYANILNNFRKLGW